MSRRTNWILVGLMGTLIVALAAASAALGQAPMARVGDVTRLQGQGINVLVGYGLVTGLDKTGDGPKFLPAMNALATMVERFGVSVESFKDIDSARNVAIVTLEVVVPDHGAREGDRLDVAVNAVAARSLAGGRLLPTPLVYHDRSVDGLFGFAQGEVVVPGTIATAGTIRGGARIERDVLMNVVTSGADLLATGFTSPWIRPDEHYITLVLDEAHAGWSMAAAVAQAVDKELGISADVERVAMAMDSSSIVVWLPGHQRGDPASWIRDIEQTTILVESNEARVAINRNTGTIVITGDTRLSPVVISQRGMTVTVAPPRGEAAPAPALPQSADFVPIDVEGQRPPNVRDLLEALNRLKVPFEDRVSILEQIHRAGRLHARLVYEG